MKIWTWTLKLNLIISYESNLSELESMMKMLYERINTADGGVTQCTAQYSNVLNCTLQSQSEKESSWTPQFSALARPSTGVSASVARCCIPVIISLAWSSLFTGTSRPYQHLTLSPLSTCLNLTQTGPSYNGNGNIAWLTFEQVFAFSWSHQEIYNRVTKNLSQCTTRRRRYLYKIPHVRNRHTTHLPYFCTLKYSFK